MMKETLHIYTRVSTLTQQEEGTSLGSQRELGIKKAEELSFEHKIWNEGGASSHYEDFENRPVLLQLLSEINEGKVTHLWVYNNDRLSRNEITAQTIRMALQKHGVTLHTQGGKFDLNNPHDKLIKTIFDGLAQFDNALRSERTRLGKLARVKQGFWHGGAAAYGYQTKDKKLVLHPEESKWVKQMYEWYNAGKSTEWIKSELDSSGVQTRRAKSLWSLGSIQKILQNSHPSGHYTYTDSKTDETVKCACPPIVSMSLWNACQEKRKAIFARRGQNNRTKRFYLLRNLMYCAHCNGPMSGRIKESKNEYLYYCPSRERNWVKSAPKKEDKWKRGQSCSMVRSLNIKSTDELVWRSVLETLLNSDYLQELFDKRIRRSNNLLDEDREIELKKLKNKEKRLKKELGNIFDKMAEVQAGNLLGNQNKQISQRVLKNLSEAQSEAEEKIEQCRVRFSELQGEYKLLEGYSRFLDDHSPYTALDEEDQKLYLERVVDRIDVFYDHDNNEHELKIRFKMPMVSIEDYSVDPKEVFVRTNIADTDKTQPRKELAVNLKKTRRSA